MMIASMFQSDVFDGVKCNRSSESLKKYATLGVGGYALFL